MARENKRKPDRDLGFDDLAAIEPGLVRLMEEARRHREDRSLVFCANAAWYGYAGHGPGLKPRLVALVGWGRRPPHEILSDCRAYDVAYDAIYGALPDCRGRCACQSIWELI